MSEEKKKSDPILLGYLDGELEDDELEDPYCTRIGGTTVLPEWSNFDPRRNICEKCGYPMFLLLQAHCPTDDVEDRIILVYCCNTAECNAKDQQLSWKAWRIQTTPDDAEAKTDSCSFDDVKNYFPAYAVASEDEPPEEKVDVNIETEWQKMKEINKKNPDIKKDDLKAVEEAVENVDHQFMAFQQRIARSPEQVIRWSGPPIWISTTNKVRHISDVPTCAVCGGERTVELQILPTLVYLLKPHEHTRLPDDEGLDFGVVTIYSCKKCTIPDGSPEYVHVQPSPN